MLVLFVFKSWLTDEVPIATPASVICFSPLCPFSYHLFPLLVPSTSQGFSAAGHLHMLFSLTGFFSVFWTWPALSLILQILAFLIIHAKLCSTYVRWFSNHSPPQIICSLSTASFIDLFTIYNYFVHLFINFGLSLSPSSRKEFVYQNILGPSSY